MKSHAEDTAEIIVLVKISSVKLQLCLQLELLGCYIEAVMYRNSDLP